MSWHDALLDLDLLRGMCVNKTCAPTEKGRERDNTKELTAPWGTQLLKKKNEVFLGEVCLIHGFPQRERYSNHAVNSCYFTNKSTT